MEPHYVQVHFLTLQLVQVFSSLIVAKWLLEFTCRLTKTPTTLMKTGIVAA